MTRRTLLASLVSGIALCMADLASAEVMTWRVDGQTREAIVYAPPTTTNSRHALIMSFHGRGDDMENFQYVNLHRAWSDAVVVYFQGLPSDGGLRGWQTEKGQNGDRDLKLVDAALASLRGKFNIDDSRIYASGYTNGAGFTYLLWAERPQVFAAFAPVAGRMRPSVLPSVRRPLLHIGGTRDPQVLFTDQKAAFETAIRVNDVRSETKSCGTGCTVYGGSTPAPVTVWIHQGGHEYPRGTSERIASFFHEYTLRR